MNNMLRNVLAELVKVGDEVLGLIYDFLRKLNADKTGEFLKMFKLFLRDEVVAKTSEVWKTWKIIKIGTIYTAEAFCQVFKNEGLDMDRMVKDIIHSPAFRVSGTEQDVELVNVSNEQLGFKDGAYYMDTCKRALMLGLDMCPAEVGPQLYLQLKEDMPSGTSVVVAMEAMLDSENYLKVFTVNCDVRGELYLLTCICHPHSKFFAHRRFLFLRRKP
ncbi:MAG: hypothetical protein WC631_01380 [Candidatus Paceibacterota bacterium]